MTTDTPAAVTPDPQIIVLWLQGMRQGRLCRTEGSEAVKSAGNGSFSQDTPSTSAAADWRTPLIWEGGGVAPSQVHARANILCQLCMTCGQQSACRD